MSTPSTPRKRQNLTSQSTITSFFTPSSRSTTTATTGTPDVPTPIKSSLLTVGMRVRKSVPEGYKSGSYKFNTFTVTKSNNNNNALAKLPKSLVTIAPGSPNKKREFAEEAEGKENAPVELVRKEIAMPKSLRRRFHAAIGRKEAGGDVIMSERDEFEEAGFLAHGE
ncbi:hypothetical protein C7212DRAFT_360990 [Tuber magnatum]|uniref:Uncharacterized protein n=1 Tax=Tuber magnatum TaxID=42249 RepID=A0A317SZH0_9PEZI|nr:hypothetical protein C7212DRAFT_360990 [Tuber magnatum]